MDIIALFCDIDHFYFYLKDKEIVIYKRGGIWQVGICTFFLTYRSATVTPVVQL